MISLFDNCLFVHIPKVAGQSIETVFLKRAGLSWQQREKMFLCANTKPSLGPPRLAHLFANEYVSLGYVTPINFKKMFKFSFVRNPWDRLVSEYKYRNYSCSFKDFILKNFPTSVNDDYVNGVDGYRHIVPQYKFLYDNEDNLLVDFVGKFERLSNDFTKVSQLITGTALDLPHQNKTSIRQPWLHHFIRKKESLHYQEYYDDETKCIVAELYRRDIELFGYTFD